MHHWFKGLCSHRKQYTYLLFQFVRREIVGRYRGSILGVVWSFIAPLIMLCIYTFVFGFVFKARWGGADSGTAEFALNLFAGILLHALLAECLTRSAGLMFENVNYIKRIVFPLPLIPLSVVGGAAFHFLIGFSVLLVGCIVWSDAGVPVTLLLLPLLIVPFLFLVSGIAFFISATGVYIRDLAQVTPLISAVLLFMAPIFYPLQVIPEIFRSWMYLNPLTYPVVEFRHILFEGLVPQWDYWLIYLVISILVLAGGFICFKRLKAGFADVV